MIYAVYLHVEKIVLILLCTGLQCKSFFSLSVRLDHVFCSDFFLHITKHQCLMLKLPTMLTSNQTVTDQID